MTGGFRAVSVAVQFFHMMMVIETVQSADAISVLGYRRCYSPQVTKLFADQEACYATGRENPLFRYDDSSRIASLNTEEKRCALHRYGKQRSGIEERALS